MDGKLIAKIGGNPEDKNHSTGVPSRAGCSTVVPLVLRVPRMRYDPIRPGRRSAVPAPNGKPWAKSEQQRPLAAACAVARIEPVVNFHGLRHTYASRLAMRGVPLAVIAAQLGHADTRMSYRRILVTA